MLSRFFEIKTQEWQNNDVIKKILIQIFHTFTVDITKDLDKALM